MKPVISVKNISKKYPLYDTPQQRLKEALIPFRKKHHRDFWALRDISFEVKKGQALGIIGRNGSGKSTLLQIVCGILRPNLGEMQVNGQISALLELGMGFNPVYTGKDNVYLNLALMGFSRAQVDENMDFIEGFAEIGEFIDQPTRNYSTGMLLRLAFACAVSVHPDILVVDEALAVGDVFFQQKCYARFRHIMSKGGTCVFVSHDMSAITNLCDQAILLARGEIDFIGPPEEAVSRYLGKTGRRASLNRRGVDSAPGPEEDTSLMPAEEILENSILPSDRKSHGAGGLQVVGVRVTNREGKDALRVPLMEPLSFHILLRAEQKIYEPSTGIHLFDRLGNLIFAAGTRQCRYRLCDLKRGDELVVRLDLTFTVQPGEYTFNIGASEPSEDGPNIGYLHDRHEMLGPILVQADPDRSLPFWGIARLPIDFAHSLRPKRPFDASRT